jgi:hypothetical protein
MADGLIAGHLIRGLGMLKSNHSNFKTKNNNVGGLYAGFNLPVTKKNRTSPRNVFLGFLDFFRFSQNNFGQNSEKKSSIQS